MSESRHDRERDRIAADWLDLTPFVCDICEAECEFPRNLTIVTEAQYAGRLRADVGATGIDGSVIGVVEVIDTHGPTPHAFAEQSKLEFAYYRILNPPTSPKRRSIGYEINRGRFSYPSGKKGEHDAAWLCSAECLTFFETLKGANQTNDWDAPRCDICSEYLHDNQVSQAEFRDWAYDPNTVFCIHCAARCDANDMQWRSPGELAGGDPREWTPGKDADTADLFLAYCQAAFWSMVWSNRAADLDSPDAYEGNRRQNTENSTTERLRLVNAVLNAGDWRKAMNLLLPVGAPGWAAYEDEPERLLAFRADNCRGTASAWNRLRPQILAGLPDELVAIIKEGEEFRQRTAPVQVAGLHQEIRQDIVAPPPPPPRPNPPATVPDDDLAQAWKELNNLFGHQRGG